VAAEARVAEAEEEAAALERELALVAARSEKLQQQQTGPTEPPTAPVVIPTLAPLALSSSPDPVVSVTLVAKETEEDVATLAVKLAETEFALATLVHSIIGGGSLPPWSSNSGAHDPSALMVTANQLAAGFLERAGGDPAPGGAYAPPRPFVAALLPVPEGVAAKTPPAPGSPSSAAVITAATDSPMPFASPPAQPTLSSQQSQKRKAIRGGDLGGVGGSFASELNADGTPRDLEAALSSAVKGNLKGHGSDPNSPTSGAGAFRPWRDSRVLGRASGFRGPLNPCFDASDKLVVHGVRLIRGNPMVRFAAVAYWFALHLWLVLSFTMSSHVSR
jgi:hypothetical protein